MAVHSLRVKTLAGQWETFGVTRRGGIRPEAERAAADQGGPTTLSFTLARPTHVQQWPDLLAWSPVEYEVDGKIVWDGQIKETPSTSGGTADSITVNCRGYQGHLDDDTYQVPYVHNDLSQWRDARSFPTAELGEKHFAANGQVGSANGNQITLGWAKGSAPLLGDTVGIVLDLGINTPHQGAEAITIGYKGAVKGFGGFSANHIKMIAYNLPSIKSAPTNVAFEVFPAFGQGTTSVPTLQASGLWGSLEVAEVYRYVLLIFQITGEDPGPEAPNYGAGRALLEDVVFTITNAQVAVNTKWLGPRPYTPFAGASNLRASDVVLDAVARTAPLLTAEPGSPTWYAEVLGDGIMDGWGFSRPGGESGELASATTLDTLERTEAPLKGGLSQWTALSWVSGAGPDTTTGWAPASFGGGIESEHVGARWNVAEQVNPIVKFDFAATGSVIAGRYFGLWACLAAAAHSGYFARVETEGGAGQHLYTVTLEKWVAGAKTVLATVHGVEVVQGSRVALAVHGGKIQLWLRNGTGGASTVKAEAKDATFTTGYTGMQAGTAAAPRFTNFAVGEWKEANTPDLGAGYGSTGKRDLTPEGSVGGFAYGQPSLLADDSSTGVKLSGGFFKGPAIWGSGQALGVTMEFVGQIEAGATTRCITQTVNGPALLVTTANKVQFVVPCGTTTVNCETTAALPVGVPLHIVATYDQGNNQYNTGSPVPTGATTIWVNGVQQTLTGTTKGVGLISKPTEPLYVGKYGATASTEFLGVLQKLIIYGWALTPSQVEQHYKAAMARQYGGVVRTQFKLPGYAPTTQRTGREQINAVNSVHLWRTKVLVGGQVLYTPQASAVKLAAAPGIAFQDASSNDGELVYNRCVVEGTNVAGEQVYVSLTAGQLYQSTSSESVIGVPQLTNPGFEAGATGWTSTTQSALHAQTGTKSGEIPSLTAAVGTFGSGTFRANFTYHVRVWVFQESGGAVSLVFGLPSDSATVKLAATTLNVWSPVDIYWTPRINRTSGVTLTVTPLGTAWIDSLASTRMTPTVVCKQGFIRTKVLSAGANIDTGTAEALAAAFLQSNVVTPFRGSFTADAATDVVRQPSGAPVHPAELLLLTGELIRISRTNPDTGDYTRDGKIANVAYDGANESAVVTIDDDRNNLQALMQRMAVVQSGTA